MIKNEYEAMPKFIIMSALARVLLGNLVISIEKIIYYFEMMGSYGFIGTHFLDRICIF